MDTITAALLHAAATLEGAVTQAAIIASKPPSIPYAKAEVSLAPDDDFDDDFAADVSLEFKLGGKLLAQLLGKQERVLPQAVEQLRKKPNLALKLLNRGGGPMRELKKNLDAAIRSAVAEMANEDFQRGASVVQWDFATNQSLSSAKVSKDGFILFSTEVEVLGKWK